MGAKSKAESLGLTEYIIDKWEGGKNTILYVTEETNKKLQELGLHITISREGIRRAIKSHQEELAEYKKALDMAKAMADILKDNPGTEMAEGILLQLTMLLQKEIRSISDIEFEKPEDLYRAATSIANAHEKLSSYRTKNVNAFEKAKKEIKAQIAREVQNDDELMARITEIIDRQSFNG